MRSLTIKSPAKLNLYLDVLGRRSDGYHEIETIFERIDLLDEVELRAKQEGIEVSSNYKGLPTNGLNLAYRAATLLKERTKIKQGVKIKIDKRIPVGSGLGGGSSDAASVLVGLNRLWNLDMKKEGLVELGREIGADVAFFLSGRSTAIGRGRGDELTFFSNNLKPIWHVLILPALKIFTPEIYTSLDSHLTAKKRDIKLVIRALKEGDLELLCEALYNRLEEVVGWRYPEILLLKDKLKKAGVKGAIMSGSGSAVFGITETRKEAMRIKEELTAEQKSDWRVLVTRTL